MAWPVWFGRANTNGESIERNGLRLLLFCFQVTQAGAAGGKSHQLVWTPVINTLKQVFAHTAPYKTHIYSFADEWGWCIASDDAESMKRLSAEEINTYRTSR